jgi:hypothetical protein
MISTLCSFFGAKPSSPAVDPYLDIPQNASLEDIAKAIGRKHGAKAGDSVLTGASKDGYYGMITRPNDKGTPQILTAAQLGPKFKEAMERLLPRPTERPPLRGFVTPGRYQPTIEQDPSADTSASKFDIHNPVYWDQDKGEYTNEPPKATSSTPSTAPTKTVAIAAAAAGGSAATIAFIAAVKYFPQLLRSFVEASRVSKRLPQISPSSAKTGSSLSEGAALALANRISTTQKLLSFVRSLKPSKINAAGIVLMALTYALYKNKGSLQEIASRFKRIISRSPLKKKSVIRISPALKTPPPVLLTTPPPVLLKTPPPVLQLVPICQINRYKIG